MKTTILVLLVMLTSLCLNAGDEKGWKKHKCPLTTQECLNRQVQHYAKIAWDGIRVDGLNGYQDMFVKDIDPGSPGDKAGVLPGDILLELNDKNMSKMSNSQLEAAMAEVSVGETVTYTIIRDKKKIKLKVTMAAIPTEMQAKWIGKHMMHMHAGKAPVKKKKP